MPSSLATCWDQSILEHISLFIGAMAACSLLLKSFPDTIIRMVVVFIAGEPSRDDVIFPLWIHPRTLVPLSRRFVPEPVEMTYIATDTLFGTYIETEAGQAAGTPSAIGHFIRETPWLNHNVRMAGSDERICSICGYCAAYIHPVRMHSVTLQTRLRRPFWDNTEAFRAFISERIVPVDMHVCCICRALCNMPVRVALGIIASCR